MYSTITKKKCKCNPNCDKWPTMGYKGYFISHVPEELRQSLKKGKVDKANRAKVNQLSRNIKQVAKDNDAYVSDQNKKLALDVWFAERMGRCEVKCENCGATNQWLSENKEDTKFKGKSKWKSCQAHLLPKRHFLSLQTHPLNGMVMGSGFSGLCYCHDNYDSSWVIASKMKIWDEVVRRFLIMYPLIKPEEHRYIPPQLLQEVNQI